jgi:hypothetical protein
VSEGKREEKGGKRNQRSEKEGNGLGERRK